MEGRKIITKTGAICENGHIISGDIEEEKPAQHCPKCGGIVYTRCPKCGKEIPGNSYWEYYNYGVPNTSFRSILSQKNLPQACAECGELYTWADKQKEEALTSEENRNSSVININGVSESHININSTDNSVNIGNGNVRNRKKSKGIMSFLLSFLSVLFDAIRAYFH